MIRLLLGDCIDRMAELPPGSVDAVVCDPPYNLGPTGTSNPGRRYWAYFGDSGREEEEVPEGNQRRQRREVVPTGFMGIPWDGSDVALSPEFWSLVHRILVQQGVVKVFGGSRTFHRIGKAMDIAGFTPRVLETWGYGSGFPKSLDVAKALDKMAGVEPVARVKAGGVGMMTKAKGRGGRAYKRDDGGWNETKIREVMPPPTTDAAKLWAGWGTALKPAWEPVLVGVRE